MRSKSPIIPAILTTDVDEFSEQIEISKKLANSIHLDIIDGQFCQGRALKIEEWPTFKINYSEVHLMVEKPISYLEDLAKKKITRAIVHIESDILIDELAKKARELDILLGFAVNPDTDLLSLKKALSYSQYVQVMGVQPGSTGRKLSPISITAISYLHKVPPQHCLISVDGGITKDNILLLKKLGASYFVSSSAIFGEGDPEVNYNNLMTALKQDDD